MSAFVVLVVKITLHFLKFSGRSMNFSVVWGLQGQKLFDINRIFIMPFLNSCKIPTLPFIVEIRKRGI